jgi:hypothetical protein
VVNKSIRNPESSLSTRGNVVSQRSCRPEVHEHALSRMAGNLFLLSRRRMFSIFNRDPQIQCNSDTSYYSI